MTTITTPAVQVPEPLATDAAIASAPAGPCGLCSYPIRRGDRHARARPRSPGARGVHSPGRRDGLLDGTPGLNT